MNGLAPMIGVVLAGGRSRRMGTDKATMVYPGRSKPQWQVTAELLAEYCEQVYLSVRQDQVLPGFEGKRYGLLRDQSESAGPLTGILTAMEECPGHAVLVVACDLPLLSSDVLAKIVQARGGQWATAYRSSHDGMPEPLCTVYEPNFFPVLKDYHVGGKRCPRKILINEGPRVQLLDLEYPEALDNANTPEDFSRLAKHTEG